MVETDFGQTDFGTLAKVKVLDVRNQLFEFFCVDGLDFL